MADFYISSSPTPIGDPDERERMPLVSVDVVYDFYFRLPTSDFRLPTSDFRLPSHLVFPNTV